MHNQKILFIIVLLSTLLITFLAFVQFICYYGLCGGEESSLISEQYLDFFEYFYWVYFLVSVISLIFYAYFKNKNTVTAFVFLLIPLLALIPYLYVEIKIQILHYKYLHHRIPHNPKPGAFVCAPGRFIYYDGGYHFHDYPDGYNGTTWTFLHYSEVKEMLSKLGLDITKCKDNSNNILKNTD